MREEQTVGEAITCEWCAEEIPAGSSTCPKCQGSISRTGQRVQGTPLAQSPLSQPARQKPPAGWYDDPKMVNTRRYWDGQKWTEHRQEVSPPAPLIPGVARNVEMPVIFQSPRSLLTAQGNEARTLFRWGLAMAILFPIIGFIIGIILLGKRATWGVRVMILSILMAAIYLSLAT
jgi:hypothetical protein